MRPVDMAFATLPTDPAALDALTFPTPWSARLFGITLALSQAGRFTLSEFQAALIASISAHEAKSAIDSEEAYYSLWIEALTSLLFAKRVISRESVPEMELRVRARIAALAHDHHDHDHDHSCSHGPAVAPIAVA